MKKKYLIGVISLIFLISIILTFYLEKNDNKTGIISLAFDDGYLTQYEIAYPLMEEYGFNGTAYILAGKDTFESRELISFEQAKEMQNNGWEIGSHSVNHPCFTEINSSKMEMEIKDSKNILSSNDLNISSFAYPSGCNNEVSKEIVQRYYDSARPLEWGYNNLISIKRYFLSSKWVNKDDSLEELCSWVNHAKENNLWLILTFHYVGGSTPRHYDYPKDNFEEILNCINSSGIKVKTVKEVIDSYGTKD